MYRGWKCAYVWVFSFFFFSFFSFLFSLQCFGAVRNIFAFGAHVRCKRFTLIYDTLGVSAFTFIYDGHGALRLIIFKQVIHEVKTLMTHAKRWEVLVYSRFYWIMFPTVKIKQCVTKINTQPRRLRELIALDWRHMFKSGQTAPVV